MEAGEQHTKKLQVTFTSHIKRLYFAMYCDHIYNWLIDCQLPRPIVKTDQWLMVACEAVFSDFPN